MTSPTDEKTQKMCELCGLKPVALNGYVCEDCYAKATYEPTVELIMLGANGTNTEGLIILTPLGMEVSPHNELAGHWRMCPDGNTWVTLLKSVDALMDRATLVTSEITERRLRGIPLMGPIKPPRRSTSGTTRTRQPKVKEEEVSPQADTIKGLQALRDKLRPKA